MDQINPIPMVFSLNPWPTNLPMGFSSVGTYQGKLAMYEVMIEKAKERRCRPDEASALTDLGKALMECGSPQKALGYLMQALPIYKEVNDREREGLTQELVALVHRAMGNLEEAQRWMERTLTVAREAHNLELVAMRLSAIGTLQIQKLSPQGALAYFKEAAEISLKIGMDMLGATALTMLGQCQMDLGAFELAKASLKRAVDLYHQLHNPVAEFTTRARYGMALVVSGQQEEGLRVMEDVVGPLRTVEQWLPLLTVLNDLAVLYFGRRRFDKARSHWEECLKIIDKGVPSMLNRAGITSRLGMIAQISGDKRRAEQYYNESLTGLAQSGDFEELSQVESNLAHILMEDKKESEAFAMLQSSIRSAERAGSQDLADQSRANLGVAYMSVGRKEEALPLLLAMLPKLRSQGEDSVGLLLQCLHALVESGDPVLAARFQPELRELIHKRGFPKRRT